MLYLLIYNTIGSNIPLWAVESRGSNQHSNEQTKDNFNKILVSSQVKHCKISQLFKFKLRLLQQLLFSIGINNEHEHKKYVSINKLEFLYFRKYHIVIIV